MKQSTRLSSAVFHLTPTRTRCDLIIIANDKKEKIASGLLNPFLAHLQTAQDQIAKGGYSILLEPETGSDAAWFTKATLERFVRFVSTPEILERVYTIETEILQIEEAISIQRSSDTGQTRVENPQRKSLGGYEGHKSLPNANEEKAIVLYTPGEPTSEANGSCSPEGNSKVQLLKVLETRKRVLQKEQGMAFARAVAAGFDIDIMAPLVSFSESFGAMRLMQACLKFMDLWKSKHETGQWLDIEALEAPATRSDLSAMNASGVALPHTPNKHDDLAAENKEKSGSTNNSDSPAPNGQQDYFQGHFPHLVFPPWPMPAPHGAQPVFQAYPVQGMPYYHTYTGNGSFFQPHHYPTEHSPSDVSPHSGQKRQSLDVGDSNTGSEMRNIYRTRSLDDMASDAEVSHSQKTRKKHGGSNRKQSGMVVIRNINYITSKEKKFGSETNSDSHSDIDAANEYFEADDNNVIHQNSTSSSKTGGSHLKSVDKLNFNNDEVSISGKATDDRHWQAFQDCLLRGCDEDAQADNRDMLAIEKDVKIKRHTNTGSDDTLVLCVQDRSEILDNRTRDIRRISGSMPRRPRGSGDEFIVHSQLNQSNFRNSSDPLAVNSFDRATNKKNIDSSNGIDDETLIAPFRSMSLDQVGGTDRTAIDIDSEIPSKYQKLESKGNKNKVNYEPNDLSLLPERGTDKRSIRYDLALGYEMQVCSELSKKKRVQNVTDVKGGLRKSDKDRMSKVTLDSLHKQRTRGPMRKGKSSKTSPLEDARARAEKLRSYKADLQKMKKEKEEIEMKRIESLKLQRQNRIAARGGSTSGKLSTLSPQTKQLQAKLPATTNRGSKFSDTEPGSSSPLQRSKIRLSLGSSESHKASKASKMNEGNHMAGNRLTRSSSSMSETKRENKGVVMPDPKASMSRIRRLSEPKAITNSPVTTMKVRSAEKRKLSEGPERNKVSAITNLDRSKAATLPELKIKTSKSHVNKGEDGLAEKNRQKVNGIRPSVLSGNAELDRSNSKTAHQIDADDNPIVEKAVLVLESEKPSLPTSYSSERQPEVTAYLEKDLPNLAKITTAEKPYQAPYARVSSLEDPCTHQSEYSKPPLASSELLSRAEEIVKTNVPGVKAPQMDKNQATLEKTFIKESSKGFRSLLKFGKKNHTSSPVDRSVDSEFTSDDGTEHNHNARKMASTSEVHTLKSLISQAETSTASNAPRKESRHFSLLSPFRSKTSEKKQAS